MGRATRSGGDVPRARAPSRWPAALPRPGPPARTGPGGTLGGPAAPGGVAVCNSIALSHPGRATTGDGALSHVSTRGLRAAVAPKLWVLKNPWASTKPGWSSSNQRPERRAASSSKL